MEAGRLGAPGLSAVEIAVGESEVERGLARILSPSTEVKPAWEQRRSFRSATSRLAQWMAAGRAGRHGPSAR